MDDLDRRLIAELRRDGRAHVTSLAHKLEVPRSTVQERLRRLHDTGVIERFVPVLDHAAMGQPLLVLMLATFKPDDGLGQREVAEALVRIPGITEVHLITGEWDFLMKLRAADMSDLSNLIIDRIRSTRGVARTLTMTSLHTVAEEPA